MNRPLGNRGYSLAELLIAMVVGVMVLSSAMSLALGTFRSMAGMQLRDGIDRNARYVGMVLQRDLTETGVGVEAQIEFGTLAVWNDSISILRVPYRGDTAAPVYRLLTGMGTAGTCPGRDCFYIASTTPSEIAAGDLVRFQYQTTRRLMLITSVSAVAGGFRINFVPGTNMLIHHAAGLNAVPWMGLPLVPDRTVSQANNVLIQELTPVMYWRQGTQLMRAGALNLDGTWNGAVIAEGVQTFDASMTFMDGDELTQASGTDADITNNYTQITGVRVIARMQAERADPRVNGGVRLIKDYEWFVAPRNLIYERNRM